MNQNDTKKITLITKESMEDKIESKSIPQEQLQREFDYIRAEKILKKALEKGLITEVEFNKIIALNRQSFSPFLAELMP